MINVRGFELVTHYMTGVTTYSVELWRQPVHRWLAARLYHVYDMHAWRLPGLTWLERRARQRHRGDIREYLPITVRQDVRCHRLTCCEREVLAVLPITRRQYEQLGGRGRS